MKHLMLTFIVLFISIDSVFSQDLSGKRVTVHARGSGYGFEYFVETSCFENQIKIKIKSKDSVSNHTLELDSNYLATRKTIYSLDSYDLKNDRHVNLFKKADSINNAYTVYDIDSVIILNTKNPAYEKLLRELFSSSMAELENQEGNKNRIVLDGTLMYFDFLQNNSSLFTARAHSPSEVSHPLLHRYIKATLAIYRKETKNTFFTIQRSGG